MEENWKEKEEDKNEDEDEDEDRNDGPIETDRWRTDEHSVKWAAERGTVRQSGNERIFLFFILVYPAVKAEDAVKVQFA